MYLFSCPAEPIIFHQTNVSVNHSCLALCSSFCRILLHVKFINYCIKYFFIKEKRWKDCDLYYKLHYQTQLHIFYSVHYKYNHLIITIAGMHKKSIQCLANCNSNAFKPNWNSKPSKSSSFTSAQQFSWFCQIKSNWILFVAESR